MLDALLSRSGSFLWQDGVWDVADKRDTLFSALISDGKVFWARQTVVNLYKIGPLLLERAHRLPGFACTVNVQISPVLKPRIHARSCSNHAWAQELPFCDLLTNYIDTR